jgi:biopolymer transport protein ExbD
MSKEPVSVTSFEKPSFFSAMMMVRRWRRKVAKRKREADEVNYLNIVAMMDMMTILLVFLLKSVSFSTTSISGITGLNLPYSTTNAEPLEAVKVFITNDAVIVEEKTVARIEDYTILPQYISDENMFLIPNLKKELNKKAEYFVQLLKINPKYQVQGNLTILSDKDTPYFVLMQVLYTVSRASARKLDQEFSFSKFRLTVLRQEM